MRAKEVRMRYVFADLWLVGENLVNNPNDIH